MTESEAYTAGWHACMAGADGCYANPYSREYEELRYAWTHGFFDATEAEDGEQPDPAASGYEE